MEGGKFGELFTYKHINNNWIDYIVYYEVKMINSSIEYDSADFDATTGIIIFYKNRYATENGVSLIIK